MSWVGQSVIGTLDTIDSKKEASFWESDTSTVSRRRKEELSKHILLRPAIWWALLVGCDGGENGECLPSIAVILSLCPIMVIRSLSQITQQQHQTAQLYISLRALFAQNLQGVSRISQSLCHIKLVSVVLFTSYFRLEQGQTHLSSSFSPINTINSVELHRSIDSADLAMPRPQVTCSRVLEIDWFIREKPCDWLWSFDFIRRLQKHSRDLLNFWQ